MIQNLFTKMSQLEIEYFWPLTEQINLNLDFTPCEEYEEEKQKKAASLQPQTQPVGGEEEVATGAEEELA